MKKRSSSLSTTASKNCVSSGRTPIRPGLLIKSRSFGQILILSVIPGNSNLQITSLSEELARKSDDASRQQEEITHLLSQIVDLQKKVKLVGNPLSLLKLYTNWTFFTIMASVQRATRHIWFSAVFPACLGEWGADSALGCSKGRPAAAHCWGETLHTFSPQSWFPVEITRTKVPTWQKNDLFPSAFVSQLRELEDKYAECMEMLHEAQEELKNLRNKTLPLNTPRRFHSLGLFPMVSCLCKHHPSVAYIVPGAPENLVMFWVFPSRTLWQQK